MSSRKGEGRNQSWEIDQRVKAMKRPGRNEKMSQEAKKPRNRDGLGQVFQAQTMTECKVWEALCLRAVSGGSPHAGLEPTAAQGDYCHGAINIPMA